MNRWVLVLVAIPIVGFAIMLLLSYTVPERISGPKFLRKALWQRGVRSELLPAEFYDECTAWAVQVAKFTATMSSSPNRKAEFVRTLETLADTVVLWMREPKHPMFGAGSSEANTYRAIFEKYEFQVRR